MHLHEKNGGKDKSLNSVVDFKETVQACNLINMGYKGYPFTWSNRRYGINFIEERLDRVLCSKDWCSNFQNTSALHLVNWVSDHCPLVSEVKERCGKNKYESRPFPRDHYDDTWSSYEACKNIVKDEWDKYGEKDWEDPVQHFQRVARNSLAHLKIWSKVEFDGRRRKQDQLIQHLQSIKHNNPSSTDGEEIRRIENKINNMLMDEEIY